MIEYIIVSYCFMFAYIVSKNLKYWYDINHYSKRFKDVAYYPKKTYGSSYSASDKVKRIVGNKIDDGYVMHSNIMYQPFVTTLNQTYIREVIIITLSMMLNIVLFSFVPMTTDIAWLQPSLPYSILLILNAYMYNQYSTKFSLDSLKIDYVLLLSGDRKQP